MFPGLAFGRRPSLRDWEASRALWRCPGPWPPGPEALRGPRAGAALPLGYKYPSTGPLQPPGRAREGRRSRRPVTLRA